MLAVVGTERKDSFKRPFVVTVNKISCGLSKNYSRFLGVGHSHFWLGEHGEW